MLEYGFFMSDTLTDNRKLRVLNVIDDCNREAVSITAGLSYPARALVETLENLKQEIGTPRYIRYDKGPEFISKTFTKWCQKNHIEIKYTLPGKPMQKRVQRASWWNKRLVSELLNNGNDRLNYNLVSQYN